MIIRVELTNSVTLCPDFRGNLVHKIIHKNDTVIFLQWSNFEIFIKIGKIYLGTHKFEKVLKRQKKRLVRLNYLKLDILNERRQNQRAIQMFGKLKCAQKLFCLVSKSTWNESNIRLSNKQSNHYEQFQCLPMQGQ